MQSSLKTTAKSLHDLLLKKKLTFATAESCTAGLVCSSLAEYPGSSTYLLGGIVSYSNSIKASILNVSEETLKNHGAVSKECAMEMVKGLQQKFNSDIALSITGIAGPDGGSKEKPVGTIYFGLAFKKEIKTFHKLFLGTRNSVREQAAEYGLDLCASY